MINLTTAVCKHPQIKGDNTLTTTDFSQFGHRERAIAAELLTASTEIGFPDDFDEDGITIMVNKSSGSGFFTNEEFQVYLMNGDKLESFYSCPVCGHEGFIQDMPHGEDDDECQEYLDDIRDT